MKCEHTPGMFEVVVTLLSFLCHSIQRCVCLSRLSCFFARLRTVTVEQNRPRPEVNYTAVRVSHAPSTPAKAPPTLTSDWAILGVRQLFIGCLETPFNSLKFYRPTLELLPKK